MQSYFRLVSNDYFVSSHLLSHIHSTAPSEWQGITEFDVLRLDRAVFHGHSALLDIIHAFGCESKLCILRLQPWYNYSWHVDLTRACSFNLLLSGYDSICMFGRMRAARHYDQLAVLPYAPNKLWLLNTHASHSVVNFSETRYLLSMSLPGRYTFESASAQLDSLGL